MVRINSIFESGFTVADADGLSFSMLQQYCRRSILTKGRYERGAIPPRVVQSVDALMNGIVENARHLIKLYQPEPRPADRVTIDVLSCSDYFDQVENDTYDQAIFRVFIPLAAQKTTFYAFAVRRGVSGDIEGSSLLDCKTAEAGAMFFTDAVNINRSYMLRSEDSDASLLIVTYHGG